MAYCTADTDVRPLVLKITDAVKSDAEVAYFISLADDYINGRLSSLYTVPFSSTPPVVKQISSHLAAHLTIRAIYAENKQDPKDTWMNVFKVWAMDLLKEIEEGKILLVDSSGSRITRSSVSGIYTSNGDRGSIFDVDDETNWRIPDSQIEEANQKREES